MLDISQIRNGIETLHDDDFSDLLRWMSQEFPERRLRKAQEQGQAVVVEQLREQGVIETPTTGDNPQPWENPGTIHAHMYLMGDVVSHGGKVWRSTHQGLNSWEPGAAGIDYRIWQEVEWADDAEDDGVINFLAGHPVSPGDIIRFGGALYEVLQAHTMADHWPPDALPAMYRPI